MKSLTVSFGAMSCVYTKSALNSGTFAAPSIWRDQSTPNGRPIVGIIQVSLLAIDTLLHLCFVLYRCCSGRVLGGLRCDCHRRSLFLSCTDATLMALR